MQQLNAAPSPERALFRAVIEQALRDACLDINRIKNGSKAKTSRARLMHRSKVREMKAARDDARRWLMNPNADFQEVCDLADMRPELVRRVAEDLKANGWQGHNTWKHIL